MKSYTGIVVEKCTESASAVSATRTRKKMGGPLVLGPKDADSEVESKADDPRAVLTDAIPDAATDRLGIDTFFLTADRDGDRCVFASRISF